MKKLISLIGAIGLTVTSSAAVVSCGKDKTADKPKDNNPGEGNNKPNPNKINIGTIFKEQVKEASETTFSKDSMILAREKFKEYKNNYINERIKTEKVEGKANIDQRKWEINRWFEDSPTEVLYENKWNKTMITGFSMTMGIKDDAINTDLTGKVTFIFKVKKYLWEVFPNRDILDLNKLSISDNKAAIQKIHEIIAERELTNIVDIPDSPREAGKWRFFKVTTKESLEDWYGDVEFKYSVS